MSISDAVGAGELQGAYDSLAREYELGECHHTFGGRAFSFLSVLDSYALLDRISPEEFQRDEKMPYWAEIWPASLALSEFLVEKVPLRGSRAVEIGAGVGPVSVVAAAAGASVLATDYCEEALRFISYNALKNAVRVEVALLDWREIAVDEQFDLLLAADVLYERGNLLPVINAIDTLLKPGGVAYIADPRRRLAEQFLELAHENDFRVGSFPREYAGGKHPVGVTIYRISR